MIKHIVMWTLKDRSRAEQLKQKIDDLNGKVPSMIDVESGINFNPADAACDLVLISTHKTREDLDAYQADPVHGEVKKAIGPEAVSRHVVDFETDD